jgi:hypothetical protein
MPLWLISKMKIAFEIITAFGEAKKTLAKPENKTYI